MASVVDICNIALSRLGDEASVTSIDPPEGSAQSEHCARWYPLTRDKALQAFPWSFATKTTTLAPLATKPCQWEFAYKLPADCLRIIEVVHPSYVPAGSPLPYRVEIIDGARCLITNVERVSVRYIFQQHNSSFYTPSFVDALAWLLASDLAGSVHTGSTGISIAQNCYKAYMTAVEIAKIEDVKQQSEEFEFKPRMQGDYYG